MYVCMCNGVTDSAIRRAAHAGIRTLDELAMTTGCGAGCGCCSETAESLLREAVHSAGSANLMVHAGGIGAAA
ncbi:MAG: (2Fe-2S)-binding protein [Rhodanobacteraceae bacterium]|nr:(2Fe-2S)-binding protein [Rhodanobacteraceae bacterium]